MNEGTKTRATVQVVRRRNIRAQAARRNNLGKAARAIPTRDLRWMLQPPVAYQCFKAAGAHQRLTGEAGQAKLVLRLSVAVAMTANRSAVMERGIELDAAITERHLSSSEPAAHRDGTRAPIRCWKPARGRAIESSPTLKLLVWIPNVWVGFAPSISTSIHKLLSQQTVKPADAVINRE
jgi:hypothetical protein